MSEEKKGLDKSLFSAGGVALVLSILILVNLIFSRVSCRWDTTEDNLYSLSEGTKKILSNLEQDVSIKVFYSKDNINLPPHIKTYARRVLDFLSEYEKYGSGKIGLEVYNPKPDSDEEDWARKYGIEAVNLPMGERTYFGLVAMAADQEEVIPMLDPSGEEHLEYDITRIISRVQSSEKRKIGIVSGLPVFGQPAFNMGMPSQGAEPWLFVEELKKNYEVKEITADSDSIEAGTDLLLMVYPKNLSARLQYAVDQYVLNGGDVIVYADPLCFSDTSPGQDKSSAPEKLFSAWGVSMDKGKIVADFDYSTKVRNQNNQVENSPLWISVKDEAINAENITTAKLESMLLPGVGAIEKDTESTFDYEPLVRSSKNSALTESFKVRFGANMLRRDFKASVDRYDLAVKVLGKFKTAFPDGKPKDEKAEKDAKADAKADDANAEHLTEGKKKSAVVIVADADMLFDSYYVSRQNFMGFKMSRVFNDNLNFLLNTTEMLTGSEELIGIRSRGKSERPFTKVQELERKAQTRWLTREQELMRKADETNRKLKEFEEKKDKSQRFVMSAEQEAEISRFQEEKRRVNAELKQVRRNLRAEIESLGNWVKFYNIVVMPFFVSLAGIGYALYRRKKSLERNS